MGFVNTTSDTEGRSCRFCGQALERRGNESAGNFQKRRTCNRDCYLAYQTAKKVERAGSFTKICRRCGQKFTKKDTRTSTGWRLQKFCGTECARKARRGKKWRIDRDKPGKPLRAFTAPMDWELLGPKPAKKHAPTLAAAEAMGDKRQ